jgi:hypothetical protein
VLKINLLADTLYTHFFIRFGVDLEKDIWAKIQLNLPSDNTIVDPVNDRII